MRGASTSQHSISACSAGSGRPNNPRASSLSLVCFFFFSSRRRHTRLQGDWSSDVCSSDLQSSTTRSESPVSLLSSGDKERVVELCYECKLCFPKCPYVPPHEFAVDFPRQIGRASCRERV